MWHYLQSKWQSLIFRLLLYFFISMLVIAAILATSFAKRFKPHFERQILPNVDRYIEYLIDDIGNPPDLAVAQQLANSLPFEVRIEGQGIDWASNPDLRPIDNYEFEAAPHPYANVYFGRHENDKFLLIGQPPFQYLFVADISFRKGSERRHWILFLWLGLTLLVLYFAIRRLFNPIQAISEQVNKIGMGELEQSIESKGKGELALLANGINRMSAQIKSMLESKSALLLAISHEMRSPMTRMRVNLELLDESEIKQSLIDDIREMESLVSAILESEKLSLKHKPITRSRCQIVSLIEEVIQAHPCRQRINTSLTPIEMNIDQMRIKLLIKNLLDNACHYSANRPDPIEVELRQDGDFATITVHDHGVGIDSNEIPRLTEAFYRPDTARQRNTGGYGLGLYLCQLIIEAHHGEMLIESESGVGTKIEVKLPI